MSENVQQLGKPTAAFVGASWVALMIGAGLFFIGLWNAEMLFIEKGFYLAVFLLGLFAAISVQKAVRDRAEDVPVTSIYVGIAWAMLLVALLLMGAGLWNSEMTLSEKGFYGIGLTMALFAAVAVQKNVRDIAAFNAVYPSQNAARAWTLGNTGDSEAG